MRVLILTEQEVKDLQNVAYSAMQQADQIERTKPLADRLEIVYEKLRKKDEPFAKEELALLADKISEELKK